MLFDVTDAAHGLADVPVAESGSEPFDLGDDRLGGVPGVPGRDVGVGVDRLDSVTISAGVRHRLLHHHDERFVRHDAAMDLRFRFSDLTEATSDVDGAGVPGIRVLPRHAAVDSEVGDEGAGAVLVAGQGPGDRRVQCLSGNLRCGTGRCVEHNHLVVGEFRQ